MKKIYCLLFAILPLTAFAGEVKVTKPTLTLENDTLTLDFDFNVEEVKVNSTQSYAFTPVLFYGKSYQTLPPVVVSGKKHFKMRRKDRRIAKKGDYTQPYTIVKGKSADRQDRIDYKISIPYQEWMSKADMWILQEGKKDCLIDLPEIQIIEPEIVEEAPALPQKGAICEPCMNMVSYLTPTEQPLKIRSEQNTLYIEYAVGGTEFKADYKNNSAELQKLKETLNPLTEGDLITFKAINICGYASPDGSAKTNDRVATKRADSFALYLKGSYNFQDSILKVTSAGEDWNSLIEMLKEEKPAYAEKALEIIAKYPNLDVREARLKSGLGTSYRTMVNDYFSRLRRLSISVEYEIREVRNSEAAELIYTNPKMLNLQEMYGVAKKYQPGTKEYKEVYEIAATNYPQDVVANINAASANIVYGDFDRAKQYMERVKDDPRAWNNMGVLAWLSGDSEIAQEWFTKALTVEPEKAQENLNKMK
ncbi:MULTISPECIES: DUF3868 domain-containing protein [Bacteroides]|uniref:DUF3868 domain-containing protein n=1 Tax=Bacteroides TaxID=816 RepID=UPI000C783A64|nr:MULTISPECIES: DUF3868 domain-containing protein [Bacteroides]RGM44375.1 DUF3868 domain-containing protein [Bacteroides sp. OM08-11]